MLSATCALVAKATLGPEDKDDMSVVVLNRIASYTNDGIELEVDQRHVEIIIRDSELEGKAKGVTTPGVKSRYETEEDLKQKYVVGGERPQKTAAAASPQMEAQDEKKEEEADDDDIEIIEPPNENDKKRPGDDIGSPDQKKAKKLPVMNENVIEIE